MAGETPAVKKEQKIWTPTVIFSTFALCASGTFSIMSFKIQGTTYTFKHSMLQTFLMFLGEYLNLIVFAVPLMFSKSALNSHFKDLTLGAKKTKRTVLFSKLWAAIPCALDAIGSGLSITSLLLLPASVSQMLQGGQIVSTAIFSKLINNRPVLRHHKVGILFATIGFVFVGIAGYVATHGSNADSNSKYTTGGFIMGIIFIFINLIFQAVQSNIEELILTRYAMPVKRMVGLEGLFGIIWMFCVLIILQYIPCPNDQLCDMGGYTEDIATGLKALFAQPGLVAWSCVTIFAVFFVNLNAMILIQKVSAVFRIFWSNTTTIFIWIVCLVVGYEEFIVAPFFIQLAGFAFLITGNFTYNEVIVWKICGLDKDIAKPVDTNVASLAKTEDESTD